MSASFPSAVKVFTTRNAGDTIQPAHVNDLQDEVNAIEAGYRNATAPLNSSNSTLVNLSVTGASTLVGNLTLGTVTYTFPAANPTSSGLSLLVDSTGTANTLKWGTPIVAAGMTLLHVASGTDTSAGATNVDTYALASQLTDKDTLFVSIELENTGATANIVSSVINATDTVTIGTPPIVNSSWKSLMLYVRAGNGLPLHVSSVALANTIAQITATFVTNFTGAWTIALRHSGITAPDTLKWSWCIYKIAGQ